MTTSMMRTTIRKKMLHHHHHGHHHHHATTTSNLHRHRHSPTSTVHNAFHTKHQQQEGKHSIFRHVHHHNRSLTKSISTTSTSSGTSSSSSKYFSSVPQEDDDSDEVEEEETSYEEENIMKQHTFSPPLAPSANPVFYRAYSRRIFPSSGEDENNKENSPNKKEQEVMKRETFQETITRTILNLSEIGQLSPSQTSFLLNSALSYQTFPSGRALWVAGTPWSTKPENVSGYYNCTSLNVNSLESFGLLMDLSMMGCGTGAVLEQNEHCLGNLGIVKREVVLQQIVPIGGVKKTVEREAMSSLTWDKATKELWLNVGDSRHGWVDAYMTILELSFADPKSSKRTRDALEQANLVSSEEKIHLNLNLANVRPPGSPLKGFGGTANPTLLPQMFTRVVNLLNSTMNKHLSTIDACLLIDECASAVVAGNIRRSAGMRQFDFGDETAKHAKANLYVYNEETKKWIVDSKRESLRLANHTRVIHSKPSLEEVKASVKMQYETGEGAIQYAPEAIVRANADLFRHDDDAKQSRKEFLNAYEHGGPAEATKWLETHKNIHDPKELQHRLRRYGLNPCGEIIGCDFHCNLSEVHLNTIHPTDRTGQEDAFRAAALMASCLLHQKFPVDRFRYSAHIDPIIGVSFTGLFDFFVEAFGKEWLHWMMDGRPSSNPLSTYFEEEEALYLQTWRNIARDTVVEYCEAHKLQVPSRITTVQPAGTKSLLTGASPGWHPPKATRFVRRVTFGRNDPIALACMDYGYNVIPAPSARDEETGELLDDIYDERSTEWLVEIPTEVSWADLVDAGDDEEKKNEGKGIDLSQMPAKSQWGLYWTVQTNYTDHNTSATIEFREDEIDELSQLIHGGIGHGYVSAALLARFDSSITFPRMPMEPISRETYCKMMKEVECRRVSDDFNELVSQRDEGVAIGKQQQKLRQRIDMIVGGGEAACTSEACLSKAEEMERKGLSSYLS